MAPTQNVAVVTGGGGGIGAACARLLAEQGATTIVLDIDADRAREVASAIDGIGLQADVADAAAIAALAAKIEAEIGPVSSLVTCAGMITPPCRAHDEALDHWDRIITVNLRGTYVTCTAFARAMLERRRGAIVTIGSLAGMGVLPVNSYGTSKAGIIHLTQSLAADWGRGNIRVNCVSPGPVRTPAIEASYARGDRDPARMEAQTALGRLVQPHEVAEAVCFLLSDRASAISGTNLPVDAGVYASLLTNLFGAPKDIFA
jgi:NAD(P)-dependent dehydrogenase (short-subunit alcohol dehydrogenase family)